METTLPNPSELRTDDLGRGGFTLRQNPERFNFGTDAVLLAAFCKPRKADRVLDIGAGSGILPVLLCARGSVKNVTALEVQPYEAELARLNAADNGLQSRVRVDCGDVRDIEALYGRGSFDVVVTNPPYKAVSGGAAPFTPRDIARSEVLCTLRDVVKAAAYCLKFGGKMYMVHRPERLGDVCCLCREFDIEVKTVRLVCPRAGAKPTLALFAAKRGGKAGELNMPPPLYIYGADGEYSEETRKIYYE